MKILLAITSSISAYKIPDFISTLKKQGFEVYTAITKNALEMVGKKALETMSENDVIVDIWDNKDPLIHINISKQTDVLLIAPIDANMIGKIANGIADDAISTIALAYTGRKIFAPAMNSNMWHNAIVQKNVSYMVNELGFEIIAPESGIMACKDEGVGRLASFDTIISKLRESQEYKDIKFTITSGATKEWIDPIRYITNSSSGKMGNAIYDIVSSSGGSSLYIEGNVSISTNMINGDRKVKVDTTDDLKTEVLNSLDNTDILFMVAAPLDFRPKSISDKKIKKKSIEKIDLIENDDILYLTISKKKNKTLIVSFAAETSDSREELILLATDKMNRKGADMIVANNIKDAIGMDTNSVVIILKNGDIIDLPMQSKKSIAKKIVEIAVREWKKL